MAAEVSTRSRLFDCSCFSELTRVNGDPERVGRRSPSIIRLPAKAILYKNDIQPHQSRATDIRFTFLVEIFPGRPSKMFFYRRSEPARALATSSVQYSNVRGREKERYTEVESRREKENLDDPDIICNVFFRNAKIMKYVSKIWKVGQILGITCLTFEDEPRVNPFLLVYFVISASIALVSGIFLTFFRILWSPFNSEIAASVMDLFMAVVVNMALSVHFNRKRSLKALLKLLQADDEMNHLLNDFLLLHLEDGRDREAFVELERAVQQRCAFPLTFNFLGIMDVNREFR
ncbi:hypothetical protein EVAR_31261_1 [Eumeta japonica]|uniref:Uncharacterized protein n=1 Tax=Eumeta variegata TaxID=151549 RepID=A0A4C1VYL5_EUMVA|nr:hypothetical protein EVAR_31261_1 [Eumeta japonica]